MFRIHWFHTPEDNIHEDYDDKDSGHGDPESHIQSPQFGPSEQGNP